MIRMEPRKKIARGDGGGDDRRGGDHQDHTYACSATKVRRRTTRVCSKRSPKKAYKTTPNNPKEKAIEYLKRSRYEEGLNQLLKCSPAAHRAFVKIAGNMCKREMKEKMKKPSAFKGSLTLERLENFSWEDARAELKADCPVLSSVLLGAVADDSNPRKFGMAVSHLLATVNKNKFNTVPQVTTVLMWLAGCNRKLFNQMSSLGHCFSDDTARKLVDKICVGYDRDVMKMKENVAQQLAKMDSQETSSDSNCCVNYALFHDNVNMSTHAHYERSSGHRNHQFNMVNTYAAKMRVPSLHLDNAEPNAEAVHSILMKKILPSKEDHALLRMEFEVLVTRMLVNCWPQLHCHDDLRKQVEWHIPHAHSLEMRKKTQMTPLGVLQKDESVSGDLIDILKYYNQYIAATPDGQPSKVVLWCDAKSCLGVLKAQEHMLSGDDKWQQLLAYNTQTQHWHNRLHMAMDYTKEYLNMDSKRERGSMANIINILERQNVTSDTKHCFDPTYDLIVTITAIYAILAALQVLNLKIDDEIPEFPRATRKKKEFLENLAKKVVDMAWEEPNVEEVLEGRAEKEKALDSVFCFCRSEEEGFMVGCSNLSCAKGEWFHLKCIGLSEDEVPEGNWYCCKQCETVGIARNYKTNVSGDNIDSKLQYSRGLLYQGLLQMALRDAVREGDGPRVATHWKYQLFHFFERRRSHYFNLGERFLLHINGGCSERLKRELLYGSMVNVNGGVGNNLEGDLVIEHLNKVFKENAQSSKGNLTEKSIQRHSQVIGVKSKVTALFDTNLAETTSKGKRKCCRANDKEDVTKMVRYLESEKLFQNIPGRNHKYFENYVFFNGVSKPNAMKNRLMKHQNKMAKQLEIRPAKEQ